LGLREQVNSGRFVGKIGNTYVGAALIGMTNVLDNARKKKKKKKKNEHPPTGLVWFRCG